MMSAMKKGILACAIFAAASAASAEDLGIYERILSASGSYDSTVSAFEAALAGSGLKLHASRVMYVPNGVQKSKIYILTSDAYMQAAAGEAPETISGQVMRVNIYEFGPGKKVFINMTNPVAHAHVFYGRGKNAAKMVAEAGKVADEIRAVAAKVPGTAERVQLEPKRDVDALVNFNGDGPAKMMAGFAKFEGNQNPIVEDMKPADFQKVLAAVKANLKKTTDKGPDDSSGWEIVTEIPVRPDAVYLGINNKYTEDRTTSINSDFRSEGKSDDAPLPGVDHTAAMPLEVLVVNKGDTVEVLQYGEMWRMQLYYWDSGYAAFAKYAFIPAIIEGAIEEAVKGGDEFKI